MKKIKKALRLFLWICLILLAGIGIGLSGGVPIPTNNARKDKSEINNEMVEEEEDTQDVT